MIIAKMASMTRIKNYANALMKSVKNAMNLVQNMIYVKHVIRNIIKKKMMIRFFTHG
jgi:hypothetical protein